MISEAVVPVLFTSITLIGRVVPSGTFVKVHSTPETNVTAKSPVEPTKTALVEGKITPSVGVIGTPDSALKKCLKLPEFPLT